MLPAGLIIICSALAIWVYSILTMLQNCSVSNGSFALAIFFSTINYFMKRIINRTSLHDAILALTMSHVIHV